MRIPEENDLAPEPDWSELTGLGMLSGVRSFVSSDPDGDRIRVRYYRGPSNDRLVVGKVWFGPGAEGPPNRAHGGSMAAVLDEVMGAACWVSGHTVVAAEMTVKFREMLPLGRIALLQARVVRSRGRKVRASAHLATREGMVYCEAEGLYIRLSEARLGELLA